MSLLCLLFLLTACNIQDNQTNDYQSYTIEFDSIGGSDVASVKTDTKTGMATRPKDPTRQGYIFYNWYAKYVNDEVNYPNFHNIIIAEDGWDYWYEHYGITEHPFDFNIIVLEDTYVGAIWKPMPKDVVILEAPKASNVQIGGLTSQSRLTGEFNVEGWLHFTGEPKTLNSKGIVMCSWEFVPDNLEQYNMTTGTVAVRFCENKINFETDGGFVIDDICFDESYTMPKKVLTAKNNYRFDGWSKNQLRKEYITYPQIFTSSATLYASYSAHTGEKLDYYLTNSEVRIMCVKPQRESNSFSQINGDVIIADMYDDRFVNTIGAFYDSEITSIIFGNYIELISLYSFRDCHNLIEVYIPNTVMRVLDSAFKHCINLRTVIFEEGDNDLVCDEAVFASCFNLTDVKLARLSIVSNWMFSDCYSLQSIDIPKSIQVIGNHAFSSCYDLFEVNFLGDTLQRIEAVAFGACSSLKRIALPINARLSPSAFMSTYIENIIITDEQINQIAQELHTNFIGVNNSFIVNIERGIQYSGDNFEGQYVANTESISLKFNEFSIYILNALLHEFFHHYQYVLTIGLGSETYDTVPSIVDNYSYPIKDSPPIIVVKKNDWEDKVEYYIYREVFYVLIEETTIAEWSQMYIPLLPDYSNWEQYWNQPFELHAREFAFWYTGIKLHD